MSKFQSLLSNEQQEVSLLVAKIAMQGGPLLVQLAEAAAAGYIAGHDKALDACMELTIESFRNARACHKAVKGLA